MVIKVLLVFLVFYLIGVGGVTVGFFSASWDGDWSFDYQIREALGAAARWPLLAVEMLTES